jgi:hypothetical protein
MAARGKERRQFPRKLAKAKVRLLTPGKQGSMFEAWLPSVDVSIGGVFLQSEFFLRMGTRLRVQFELPGAPEPVEALGTVCREQRAGTRRGEIRSGFAVQFDEYSEGAKLALATYFLATEVRQFVNAYRRTGRQQRLRGEEERMLDLIVAWEMDRLERGRVGFEA